MIDRFHFILIVVSVFLISSCSKDCSSDAAENKVKWEESRPNHYSFEYRTSCFCDFISLGPFFVEITGTEIDTAYYIGQNEELYPEALDFINDYENVKDAVSNFTIDAYFERFSDRDRSSSFDCEMSFNDQYHFIERYDVIPPDDIADGDFLYEISNFKNLD